MLVCLPLAAQAYDTKALAPASPFDIVTVDEVTKSQWLVGELDDFPHTIEFTFTKPTRLDVQVMVPKGTPPELRTSLIVIKEEARGVSEVMRRTAQSEEWTAYTDPTSGLEFERSSRFDSELNPGVYRLEVNNPVNQGQYVLQLGYEDTSGGYFTTVANIAELRNLLGYSTVGMIGNRYIFVPLMVLIAGAGGVWWYRRRKTAAGAAADGSSSADTELGVE